MRRPDRLLDRLKAHEGFRSLVYDDATGKPIGPGSVLVGNPTIGNGWALNKRPMTRPQADRHTSETLDELTFELLHLIPFWFSLDDVRQDTLLELAYNLGVGGMLGFPKMLDAMRRRRWDEAGAELMDSDAARALPDRYAVLRQQIVTGEWPA